MFRLAPLVGLLAGALMLTAGPAIAGFRSGDQLYSQCQGKEQDRLACVAYVVAISDAGAAVWNDQNGITRSTGDNGTIAGWNWCQPADVTAGQLADAVLHWLRQNPSKRHFNAAGLVASAFEDAYPCSR